jgi:hypothetical protein
MVGDNESSNNNNHEWLIHAYEKLEPTNYITEFIQHNVRPDGRTFCACRSVSILHSILVRNSVGSALVTFHGSGSKCHWYLRMTRGYNRSMLETKRYVIEGTAIYVLC